MELICLQNFHQLSQKTYNIKTKTKTKKKSKKQNEIRDPGGGLSIPGGKSSGRALEREKIFEMKLEYFWVKF